jgi:hypothetical protein
MDCRRLPGQAAADDNRIGQDLRIVMEPLVSHKYYLHAAREALAFVSATLQEYLELRHPSKG